MTIDDNTVVQAAIALQAMVALNRHRMLGAGKPDHPAFVHADAASQALVAALVALGVALPPGPRTGFTRAPGGGVGR
jgi:hypothetical protein